jgi:ferrochelatase
MLDAYVLLSHGTVDHSRDIPAFLRNIRRGHDAPGELVFEVSRRFMAVGGSPLNRINGQVASFLESRLQRPVRFANRLWQPYPREVFGALYREGARSVGVIALAPHSAHVYNDAAIDAASAFDGLTLHCASNLGRSTVLTDAFAAAIDSTIRTVPNELFSLMMTAHSLPMSVVRGGDPYEDEVRGSASAIAARAGLADYSLAFQSQTMNTGPGGRPIEWLGPSVVQTLDELTARGSRGVVVAPIGFLADHTEVLFDIDIEMRSWASARGMWLVRTPSLNDSPVLIDALEAIARNLETPPSPQPSPIGRGS